MIRIFRQYISPRKAVFIMGEGLLIFLAVLLASFLFLSREQGLMFLSLQIWPKVLLVAAVIQTTLYFNDLYQFRAQDNMLDIATRFARSIGITSITLGLIYFLWPIAIIGRWVFFLSLFVLMVFLVSWRLLYTLVLKKRLLSEKAIVVGDGDLAARIFEEINSRRDISYNIKSIISQNGSPGSGDFTGVPIHCGFESLFEVAEAEGANSIIVALDQKRGVLPYKELLSCKVRGLDVIDGESFYERLTGKLILEKVTPSWLIFSDGFHKSFLLKSGKRFIDLIMSISMLIIVWPLILLVSVAIKLDSKGPVMFTQERVGESGRVFKLYKFRSMVQDAEEKTGPVWAEEHDPRITRVGKFIRKLRIDELPQLWNVLKGDMSFVGPRPERPFFVEDLKKKLSYYNERFTVKPGITGWAQIKYSYGASEKDTLQKLKYDLYYIKNLSLLLDLIIIFHTAKIALLGRGSR